MSDKQNSKCGSIQFYFFVLLIAFIFGLYTDASADSAPITYSEYIKANSLRFEDLRKSADGSRIFTMLASAANPEVKDFSVWSFSEEKQTFVRHPFKLPAGSEEAFGDFSISADGSTIAFYNIKKGEVVVAGKGFGKTIQLPFAKSSYFNIQRLIAISSDNSILLTASVNPLIDSTKRIPFLSTYSIKTGKFLKSVVISSTPVRLYSDPGSRYILFQGRSTNHLRLFNPETLVEIKTWYGNPDFLDASSDGAFIALKKFNTTKIFKSNSWEEIDLPRKTDYSVSFGDNGMLLTYRKNDYEKHLISDSRMLVLESGSNQQAIQAAVYVKKAGAWFGFDNNGISVISPPSKESIQAALMIAEGASLVRAGFTKQGTNKIKEAATFLPTASMLSSTGFYVGLRTAGLPLQNIGELLLHHYNRLMTNAMPIAGNTPDLAVRRLMDYGMFAVVANHPSLALDASSKIRQIHSGHLTEPGATSWLNAAVALEALVIASGEKADSVYDYIIEQEGKIQQGERFVTTYIINFPDYWEPLYADRKKLAYLLGVDEKKLPTPGPRQLSPQPYPDLSGKLIKASGTPPPRLEKASPSPDPVAPAMDTSRTKGRVLD